MRALAILPAIFTLSACSLFDSSDPREGPEEVADCVQRVTAALPVDKRSVFDRLEGTLVPTYTYDITKLSLDAIQQLAVEGSDETAGRRLTASTNTRSTAVAMFMKQKVDEKGAFFLGHDPALYRVRGNAQPADKLISAGCERQQSDMRLIDFSWAQRAPIAKTPENENNS